MNIDTLISHYLLGKLSIEQVAEVEMRMESDPEFKQQVVKAAEMQASLDVLLEEDIRGVINDIKNDQVYADKGRAASNRIYLISLIIAALLAGLAWTSFNHFQNPAEQMLYAEYYSPMIVSNMRGGAKDDGRIAYQNKMIKANMLLDEKQYQQASNLYQALLDENNIIYNEQLEWYLALSYLHLDKQKAKDLFQAMAANTLHYKKKEATEILAKL